MHDQLQKLAILARRISKAMQMLLLLLG